MVLSLTYLSSATQKPDADELERLLRSVRVKNEALGITGLLLYADGNYVQTLEGPGDVVDAAFGRIVADPRHRGVFVAWREEIEEREYPDWSMGFREMDAEQAASIPGFNDYLALRGRTAGRSSPAEVFHRIFRDGPRRP